MPGTVKSGKSGQDPKPAGSPPMRTHCATLGVGPSSTKSICHAGGLTCAFGGAVIVHTLPSHVNAGKIVRCPMELPCVDETAARREIFIVEVVPWCKATVTVNVPPYGISVLERVYVGRVRPDRR
jgi:hypothetical protein